MSFKPGVEQAAAASSRLKLRLGKETGKLRKLRFGWSLFSEDSDMAKLEDLVQQLRYWNDGLRDILPLQHQQAHSMMTQVRVLGHLNDQKELESVGKASRSISGSIYQDIYVCCGMKREKLETGPEFDRDIGPVAAPLDLFRLPQLGENTPASVDYRLTSLHSGKCFLLPCYLPSSVNLPYSYCIQAKIPTPRPTAWWSRLLISAQSRTKTRWSFSTLV